MKRVVLTVVFGLAGVAFQWSLPFALSLVVPGDGLQRHGEDEAGRQLMVYFLFGGALFFLLWAWVGYTWAENWRKACKMVAGILLASLMILLLPRWLARSAVASDGWARDAAFMLLWVVSCAVLAYFMGRDTLLFSPNSGKKGQG